MTAWCDNTSESLAFRLRPGNAGSNTAVDHIEVLGEAIAQLPTRHRRNLLITCDGAGATLDLVRHITTLNAAPGRRVHYSVGFDLDARARTAIGRLSDTDWDQVLDHRGRPRDPDDAGVAELTGLLRRSVGGDRLATWPPDMRIICRRERPSSGAQLSLIEQADGWRYQLIATNTPPRPGRPSSSRPGIDRTPGSRTASVPATTRHRPFALEIVRAQPSLVCGRDHRLRPAVLAAAAVPGRAARPGRTENPALPAAAHRRPTGPRPTQTKDL